MIVALALLLAQVDMADRCTVVKHVVRTSVDMFRTSRGEKREDKGTKVVWTRPVQLPGADECKVIEFTDGKTQPFYGCLMKASCKDAESKFNALAMEVSQCIDAPIKMKDDAKQRTAFLHKGGVPVRLTLAHDKDCTFRFLVEPLQQDKR